MSDLIGGSRGTYASAVSGRQRRLQQQQQYITSTSTSTPPSPITAPAENIVRMESYDEMPPFFTPSYLRTSRHVSRLRSAHERQAREVRELSNSQQFPPHPPHPGKVPSNIPSNPLLSDVIERVPPIDPTLHPLPTQWSHSDRISTLEVLLSGTEVRFNGITKTTDEAASIRSDNPIPKEVGIYYFEVTILSRSKDCLIGVGFSSKKANLNRLPGWENESWAYHGDDGFIFACTASGKAYGPRFGGTDTIGCGVNFRKGEAFFTKNGVLLGTAFTGLKSDGKLFPSVGMKKPGEHVRVNFGRGEFVFDIDGLVRREREKIMEDIKKVDVKELHPPDDEGQLVRNLVGQYLAHEGYVETARAFNREYTDREESLLPENERGRGRGIQEMEEEDVHAVNRQKIRKSILEGDIDRAMKLQQSYYPRLFDEQRLRGVWFRLRCRKFVEMMKRVSEMSSEVEEDQNDDEHGGEDEEQEQDTQMDLDNQLHAEQEQQQQQHHHQELDRDNDQDMLDTTASLDSTTSKSKFHHIHRSTLESQILQYGTSLQQDFGQDPDPEIQRILNDAFGALAYSDVRESPMAKMFEEAGRAEVAEGVNGAVLMSLGKASEAALEKVCAQTEALLDEWAGKGGGGAGLVCVRGDFLAGEAL